MKSHSSSHRSSMSRSHSSLSHHRSGLSHSSLSHRSSLTRHKSSIGSMNLHKSRFKHHGISDAHAFAVGKATGVNINASAMGAHGAALHRMRKARERIRSSSSSSQSRFGSRRIRFSKSTSNRRYTASKINMDNFNNVKDELGNVYNEAQKYIWIPIVVFLVMFFVVAMMIISFIPRLMFRF